MHHTDRPLAPKTLLIDDERHIRQLFKLLLETMGYTVVSEVGNGNDVLAMCETFQPELVLMDINMPGRNGDGLISDIKQRLPDCVIIMMTSVNDKATIAHCLRSGAKNYILKGTDLKKIETTISATWNKHGLQR